MLELKCALSIGGPQPDSSAEYLDWAKSRNVRFGGPHRHGYLIQTVYLTLMVLARVVNDSLLPTLSTGSSIAW